MLDKGLVLSRENSLGGESLLLSAKGVGVLKLQGLEARAGYDLGFDGPQFFHRTLGTNYLLHKARLGDEVFGEHAILRDSSSQDEPGAPSQRLSPVSRSFLSSRFRKIPDGLIVYSSEAMGLKKGLRVADWVEVESAYKPYAELEKALLLLTMSPELNDSGTLLLNKLVFVYDSRQRHDYAIVRALRRFLNARKDLAPSEFLSHIVLAKCFVEPPLAFHGVVEDSAQSKLETEHFQDEVDALFGAED